MAQVRFNWWKWALLALIFAAIFFWGFKCGKGERQVAPTSIVVKTDTIRSPAIVVRDTHYIPKPYKVSIVKHDTISEVIREICYADTAYYFDTIIQGNVLTSISDTVFLSRILGRSVVSQSSQDTIFIRQTTQLPPIKKTELYLGFSALGGQQHFFYSIGADLNLKTKKDKIVFVGAHLTQDNQFLIQAGYKFKIKIK